jgi:type IX secretion system PorP/SprF family membrane protein
MRWLLQIIVVLGVVTTVKAQQDAQYSQYMFNTLALNPAYAGSRDVVSATVLHRKQWVNTPGSPRTTTLSIDAPFKREKVGVGLLVFNDKIGITSTTGMYGSYAFRMRTRKGTLALGLQAGFSQYSADFTSVKLDQDDKYDDAFSSRVNKFMPNFGAGVYYNTDKFYVGIGLPRLVNNKMMKTADSIVSLSHQTRHLFFMGGFVLPLSQDIKLKPSTMIKLVEGAPIQIDINTNVWFYDVVAAGLSYRISAGTVVAMVEVQATKQFRIGYSYDASLGKSNVVGRGAHEIMARYEFGYVKAKVLSPRYF